jgi:hypothetical protein
MLFFTAITRLVDAFDIVGMMEFMYTSYGLGSAARLVGTLPGSGDRKSSPVYCNEGSGHRELKLSEDNLAID